MKQYRFYLYFFLVLTGFRYGWSSDFPILSSLRVSDTSSNKILASTLSISQESQNFSEKKINIDRFINEMPIDRGLSFERRFQILSELKELHEQANSTTISLIQNKKIRSKVFSSVLETFPLYQFELGEPTSSKRILITSGSHAGTEPHTVVVALKLIRDYMAEKETLWNDTYIVIYPLLNPWGFVKGTRHSHENKDLNRVFLQDHIEDKNMFDFAESLKEQKFHLALDLHGAISRKVFFAIRNKEDYGLAERALTILEKNLHLPSVSGEYPDFAYHSTYPQRYRLLSPGVSETQTPGTIKSFLAQFADYSYTLEHPGQMYPEDIEFTYFELVKSFINQIKDTLISEAS